MPADPVPGRALVTRRAIRDVVRNAALSVYGVSGLVGGGPIGRLLGRLGLAQPGLRLVVEPELAIELHLTVAYGLPVAEVARQVDASVRYALHQALGRGPDRVAIRIEGLREEHGVAPPPHGTPAPGEVAPSDLAASGTDVA